MDASLLLFRDMFSYCQENKLFRPFVAIVFVILCSFPNASAQIHDTKFEAGLGYSLLRLDVAVSSQPGDTLNQLQKNMSGVLGRVGYNLGRNVTAEGEAVVFPQDLGGFSKGITEAVFGAKAGWRSEKFGLFGKIRPGLIHFHDQPQPLVCPAEFPAPLNCQIPGATEFALDAGGVFEFYPHNRITIRLDMGDMMIRFGESVRRSGPPDANGIVRSTIVNGFWSHNLQLGTSVGFRF